VHGQLSLSAYDLEDLVSIPTSRKNEVPEMVQHSKNTVKQQASARAAANEDATAKDGPKERIG